MQITNNKTSTQVCSRKKAYRDKALVVKIFFFAFAAPAIILPRVWGLGSEELLKQKFSNIFESKIFAFLAKDATILSEKIGEGKGALIYVLGGTQDSLKVKFRTAIGLCDSGTVNKIMLLSTTGITENDENLGRNLTNDEWALKELSSLGVAVRDIEFMKAERGFFGTLSEAQGVRTVVITRGVRNLMLVCSAYHSRRVQATFSSILKDTGASIRIQAVDETIGIVGLLTEWLKLFFYENLLLPWKGVNQDSRKSSHQMGRSVAETQIGVR